MQLAGTQFTTTSALAGNDVATFPDFPAEIRAPRGTLAGVSGFQVHFASQDILTPGDELDALVVMNPAALRTNLVDLQAGGILIANENAFDKKSLEQAEYQSQPARRRIAECLPVVQGPDDRLDPYRRGGIGTRSEGRR